MRIATINVNGIRAAARKGMGHWLTACAPDVLLLQEVRADEVTAASLLPGYTAVTWPCRVKGRAGVSVAVHENSAVGMGELRRGVSPAGATEPDVDSGRWLEADLELPSGQMITVVSAYLHSGQVGTEKMDQKYAHLALVGNRLTELLDSAAQGGPQVLMAGDFNIVRSPQDITNWKPNHNKHAGVLDEEIAHLESWFTAGWTDIVRHLAPQEQGPYTWWSQRGRAFENNTGWRIDYQMTTPELAARAISFKVDRAASRETRFSDHAPLVVDYDD
ncbi:exodeoxyribonuclease III [Actinomyces oricola]|uniref:exodeoxyribonuclease III n=1 Tax=Actinomyces oricola TaxID=206043 RepID=UPI000FFF2866|nr:exodeoxyribonuclease III [Actinomyces oricola]